MYLKNYFAKIADLTLFTILTCVWLTNYLYFILVKSGQGHYSSPNVSAGLLNQIYQVMRRLNINYCKCPIISNLV